MDGWTSFAASYCLSKQILATLLYGNLSPISRNISLKYMKLITKDLENRSSVKLPDRSSLIIDGWSERSTIFCAVSATYYKNSNCWLFHLYYLKPALQPRAIVIKSNFCYHYTKKIQESCKYYGKQRCSQQGDYVRNDKIPLKINLVIVPLNINFTSLLSTNASNQFEQFTDTHLTAFLSWTCR